MTTMDTDAAINRFQVPNQHTPRQGTFYNRHASLVVVGRLRGLRLGYRGMVPHTFLYQRSLLCISPVEGNVNSRCFLSDDYPKTGRTR